MPAPAAVGSPPGEPEPEPTAVEARPPTKVAYLTFDDGPDPRWTPMILDVLRRYNAKATFFVIGSAAERYPALLRRVVREGHTLGNHTYSHADLTRLSASAFASEVSRADRAIRRITGKPTRLLRPPYGAANGYTRSLAAGSGHRLVMWDVDPQDWRRSGASVIARTVLRETDNGEVVLLHDGGGDRWQTVAALNQILGTMTAAGYRFDAMR